MAIVALGVNLQSQSVHRITSGVQFNEDCNKLRDTKRGHNEKNKLSEALRRHLLAVR